MKCPYCGAQIANDSLDCPNCGRQVQVAFDASSDDRSASDDDRAVRSGADGGNHTAGAGSPASFSKDRGMRQKPDKKTKKEAKAEVKRTKSAYKSARKAAGKSAAPRAIALVVALLLAAAGGAYGMWSYSLANGIPFSDQQAPQSAEEGQTGSSADQAADESSAASASSSASSSAALLENGDADAYVGTWQGDMTQTKNESVGNDYRCYGASANPLQLSITQVDASGRIKADAKVLLHNHRTDDLSSDSDSVEGDQVVELKNLTGTLKNGTFKFVPDISDYLKDGSMSISASVDSDDGSKLDVLVSLDGVEDDKYILSKNAGDSDEG